MARGPLRVSELGRSRLRGTEFELVVRFGPCVAEGTSVAEFTPDVGVLIVHGIGTQAEGSELRHWVDSVVSYLEAFRTPAERATGPGSIGPTRPTTSSSASARRRSNPPRPARAG